MKNLRIISGIAILGVMFAGSVMADSIGMEEQKRQMEMDEKAAMGGSMPMAQPDTPSPPNGRTQDKRDLVGMPLDDGKSRGDSIGGDHILEMNDNVPAARKNPMTVDGTE